MIPVITIDGPAGAGKGTVAKRLSKRLGWNQLDSGALYRVMAWVALEKGVTIQQTEKLSHVLDDVQVEFSAGVAYVDGRNVEGEIRHPDCSRLTSQMAALPVVRSALLERQRAFQQLPGLVADGRDMGTVVFPNAQTKFFLTASPEVRAQRRFQQLSDQGISANLLNLVQEIAERDKRDAQRLVAPLKPAVDAILIDNSHLDIDQVMETISYHL